MRDDGWCTWHHRKDCVGGKLKTDGSMRRTLLPLLYRFLSIRSYERSSYLTFCLELYIRLRGLGLIITFQFHFLVSRVELRCVRNEIFVSIKK
jgi:hypothetical protein